MNVRQTQKLYETWFEQFTENHFVSLGPTGIEDYKEWLAQCGYFTTITFDQRYMSRIKARRGLMADDTSLEFDCFHRIYMNVLHLLLGKRSTRARHRISWPLAIPCIDFEGSKYASEVALTARNLHIHALVAVPPSISADFDRIVRSPDVLFRFQEFGPIDAVSFDPYDPQRSHSFSYAAKVQIKTLNNPSSAEQVRIYPNPDLADHRIKYQLTNSYPELDRKLRNLRFALRVQVAAEQRRLTDCPWEAAITERCSSYCLR